MPQNTLSIGRDVALDVTGPTGPIALGLVTGFTARPQIKEQRVKGIDGITRMLRFPDGWDGSFDIERQGNELDNYIAREEDAYYAGRSESPVTITQTIQEPNGSVSQYRFTGVFLKLDDAGRWAGDASVQQKVSFVASRRIKVA